jgi:hypothetical protein
MGPDNGYKKNKKSQKNYLNQNRENYPITHFPAQPFKGSQGANIAIVKCPIKIGIKHRGTDNNNQQKNTTDLKNKIPSI